MSIQRLGKLFARHLHSGPEALSEWMQTGLKRELILSQTLSSDHLSDLYITLPTRDGTTRPYEPPIDGQPMGYGHHLVFFHPRNPERDLRPDGTDADFCPPEPYTRRMWAGGRIQWKKPLIIGQKATALSTVASVEHKGVEKGSPMVFVKQKIELSMADQIEPCVEEERTHVYLPTSTARSLSKAMKVKDFPNPEYSFTYKPSLTTLFRFSALTFNGHHIHLDKEYAQNYEGYSERLVHGPLTALMLLEAAALAEPNAQFELFEYRALQPLTVGQSVKLHVAREDQGRVLLWAENADGVTVMSGKLSFASQ